MNTKQFVFLNGTLTTKNKYLLYNKIFYLNSQNIVVWRYEKTRNIKSWRNYDRDVMWRWTCYSAHSRGFSVTHALHQVPNILSQTIYIYKKFENFDIAEDKDVC